MWPFGPLVSASAALIFDFVSGVWRLHISYISKRLYTSGMFKAWISRGRVKCEVLSLLTESFKSLSTYLTRPGLIDWKNIMVSSIKGHGSEFSNSKPAQFDNTFAFDAIMIPEPTDFWRVFAEVYSHLIGHWQQLCQRPAFYMPIYIDDVLISCPTIYQWK